MHVGKVAAALVVCGFRFWGRKTPVSFFLIHDALEPRIVHRGFCAEDDDVGRIQHFTLVEHVSACR
ncbi:hypothetical protein D3C81_1797450 [compost metagenome]